MLCIILNSQIIQARELLQERNNLEIGQSSIRAQRQIASLAGVHIIQNQLNCSLDIFSSTSMNIESSTADRAGITTIRILNQSRSTIRVIMIALTTQQLFIRNTQRKLSIILLQTSDLIRAQPVSVTTGLLCSRLRIASTHGHCITIRIRVVHHHCCLLLCLFNLRKLKVWKIGHELKQVRYCFCSLL